ncbi:MAG: hypothetical protein U5J97_10260 [Trueperaceae bacterium]|nr:hypothetical protein [Trueperaceae bacterium]
MSSTITIDDLARQDVRATLWRSRTTETGFTVTNLADGETVTSVDLASDAEAAEAGVGTYDVTGSNPVGSGGFAATNYDLTWAAGAIDVLARDLTIGGQLRRRREGVRRRYLGATSPTPRRSTS